MLRTLNCSHSFDRNAQRGTSLLMALMLTMIGLGLCAAMMTTVASRATLTRASRSGMVAMEIASSGLSLARAELLANKDYDGNGVGAVAGELNQAPYVVSCKQLDATHFQLTSTARYDIARRTIESVVEVLETSKSVFSFGAFGDKYVTIGGGTVSDAYDSTLGPYATQAVNSDAHGTYAAWGSPIGSNGPITIGGAGTFVRGDVTPGVSSSTTINGGAGVDGATAPLTKPFVFPPVETTEIYDANGKLLPTATDKSKWITSGKVTISGDNVTVGNGGVLTIPTGNYYLSNLKVLNGGVVKVAGAVHLYIGHSLDSSGGSMVNESLIPANFQIYGLGDDSVVNTDSIKVSTKLGLYASVYSPHMPITMTGGGFFFGAMVGNALKDTGGSAFHFDLALQKLDGTVKDRTVKQLSWRRAATPDAEKSL